MSKVSAAHQRKFVPNHTVIAGVPMKTILTILLVATLTVAAQTPTPTKAKAPRKPHPSLVKVEDVAGLPRVLLIGDSISMGYTVEVRKMLAGKANIHRIPANGGPTTNGLANITKWLGESKWDVIHFNWGLHDCKYMGPDPKVKVTPDSPGAKPQVSLANYEKNLGQLVKTLQATGAKLIWCNTTPVPAGADGRRAGDEGPYNAAAAKIMDSAGIATDDLCSHAQAKLKDIQLPANVHYTDTGSRYLAEKVSAVIGAALPQK
jgi:hypothetical protein